MDMHAHTHTHTPHACMHMHTHIHTILTPTIPDTNTILNTNIKDIKHSSHCGPSWLMGHSQEHEL